MKTYASYVWYHGTPIGREELDDQADGFRIWADSYNKRISIEKFSKGEWVETIYDSALLDYRHLKPEFQHGWESRRISETPELITSHLRDEAHRLVAIEGYRPAERVCELRAPSGVLLGREVLYQCSHGASFDGVVLFDANGIPVLVNLYDVDELGDFAQKREADWDLYARQDPWAQELFI